MRALLAVCALSGCISGRVLSGYPGYPFASFSIPEPADSAFFELQAVLAAEGYPIDYTDRESGLIATRPGPDGDSRVFLSVVVGPDPDQVDRSSVWVAGFETTTSGNQRINPLDEALWADVMSVSGRISERLGGSAPLGPDERSAAEDP